MSIQPDSIERARLACRNFRLVQIYRAAQKMAASTFRGNRQSGLSSFAAFFLCYCSALKEMNDDRNHRK